MSSDRGRNPKIFETAFEKYEERGRLGRGGSGEVYLVANSDDQEYALTLLAAQVLSGEKRGRFRNEIGFCLQPVHENVLRIIDCGVYEARTTLSHTSTISLGP